MRAPTFERLFRSGRSRRVFCESFSETETTSSAITWSIDIVSWMTMDRPARKVPSWYHPGTIERSPISFNAALIVTKWLDLSIGTLSRAWIQRRSYFVRRLGSFAKILYRERVIRRTVASFRFELRLRLVSNTFPSSWILVFISTSFHIA